MTRRDFPPITLTACTYSRVRSESVSPRTSKMSRDLSISEITFVVRSDEPKAARHLNEDRTR